MAKYVYYNSIYKNVNNQQIIQIYVHKLYVYEFTGCVLTFYCLTMGNWNDKDYNSMLKKVN